MRKPARRAAASSAQACIARAGHDDRQAAAHLRQARTRIARARAGGPDLRKRGLKAVLVKSDQGYLFDPTVEVRQVAGALCPGA